MNPITTAMSTTLITYPPPHPTPHQSRCLPARKVFLAHAKGHAVLPAWHSSSLLCVLDEKGNKKVFCMHSKSFGYKVDIIQSSGHLVEGVALHRFKGPGTLAGRGSRGQWKAEFLDFWFLNYFFFHLVLLEFHLQVEGENWELGSSQPS